MLVQQSEVELLGALEAALLITGALAEVVTSELVSTALEIAEVLDTAAVLSTAEEVGDALGVSVTVETPLPPTLTTE